MSNFSQKIRNLIQNSLEGTNFSDVEFIVEHPKNLSHGDYATNVAFILAKKIGTNPSQVAKLLVEKMVKNLPEDIAEITIAESGFINFKMSPVFFRKSLSEILDTEQEFGKNKKLLGQKIVIEFTDPNPFKQFHIGHIMSNVIGESFARLLSWNGAKVTRVCYQGDVGMHVAKALWGILYNAASFPKEEESLSVKMKFLGQAYVLGSEKYEKDEESKKEIQEINKKIYDFYNEKKNTDPELEQYYEIGKKWSLKHFDEIYAKLGTTFDHFIFESSVFEVGEKFVRENIGKVFEESEGAIVYRGEQDGLHTRVFINSQDLPTYESKDLGLALRKEKLGNFDKSIVVTGNEQKEYFKVILAVLSKTLPQISEKTLSITHGLMQFTDKKISSRTGNVITGESLLSDLEQTVSEKLSDREFDENLKTKIKSDVSIAALKYSILKQAPGRNIIFDKEKAISFEGDSGPYIQYSYIRAKSIIEKARAQNKFPDEKNISENREITKLEKILYTFPDVIEKALEEMGPQHIITYATEIASEFNSFYGREQILDGSNSESYKLAITKAVMIVLANALRVSGIRVPEKM